MDARLRDHSELPELARKAVEMLTDAQAAKLGHKALNFGEPKELRAALATAVEEAVTAALQ